MSPGFGMLPHRALAAALLGLVGPGLAAEERWLEVRSAHFQVVANTGAREARRAARRLERFHAAVHRLVPGDEARGVPLTTVLLFKDTASLGPLFPVYQGKRRPIGGLFARGQDRNYIAVAPKGDPDAFQSIFHEYTHLLLARLPEPLPLWLGEGLAELYSNAEVREREVVVARPFRDHVRLLRERGLISMEAFFAAGQDSPYYNDGDKQAHFYAQSWATAHYVFIQRRAGPAFMAALAAGRSSAEAGEAALGLRPDTLQKELARYLGRLTLPHTNEPVAAVADETLREAPVALHEALFYRGDCLSHLGRVADARPFHEKALALMPTFAAPHRSMGLGHFHAREFAAAARWLSGAIERDPRDGWARYLHASAVVRAAGESFGPAAAATLQEDLRVATALLPDLADAWQLRAYVDSVLGRIDDEAVHALRRALELSPGRADLQQRLDLVLARRGPLESP